MIRVLLAVPLGDDEVPQEATSVNLVFYDAADRMALYFRDFPIPDLPNVIQVYETPTASEVV